MNEGLLWYDGDPTRDLNEKVGRAAERYRAKFDLWPNTCYVHPSIGADPGAKVAFKPAGGHNQFSPPVVVRILAAPNILRNHFWIGNEANP